MIKRITIQNNPDILYIFTDNTDRDSGTNLIDPESWYSKKYGKGHHYPNRTSAVARGLDNAYPISTQKWYHGEYKREKGNWTDKDIEIFKAVINCEFIDILNAWKSKKYKSIVFTTNLFNGPISNITKERTPKIYEYLCKKLQDLKLLI